VDTPSQPPSIGGIPSVTKPKRKIPRLLPATPSCRARAHPSEKNYRPSWFAVPHMPLGCEQRSQHAAARLTSASKRLPSVPTCVTAHDPPRLLSSDPHRFMMMLQESVMQSSGWGYAPVQETTTLGRVVSDSLGPTLLKVKWPAEPTD
jgi:hypothetical protein